VLLAFWLPYVALVLNAGTWIYWLILSISLKQEESNSQVYNSIRIK